MFIVLNLSSATMEFTSLRWWSLLLLIQGSLCLRNVRLIAPDAVQRGTRAEMRCHYDLEQEVLYTVKWYRGDREFCRYSPRDVPPLKVFEIRGLEVNRTETDMERLVIERASKVADGGYMCEVSAEAPSFQTAQVYTSMHVVDLPAEGPELHGIRHRYRAGAKLKAECVSRGAYPAANLSFFINSEPASMQHVWQRVEVGPDKLMTAYSTIQFVVQKHNFVGHRIKVRCTAIIYSIYLQSTEKSAFEEREKVRATEESKIFEAVVFPIHRLPENSGAAPRWSQTLPLIISLFLPTVLS